MPKPPLPCCPTADAQYVTELPHVYQFDFDLYQCRQCSRYWAYAWREGQQGWETVAPDDADTMQKLEGDELRVFMRAWAQSFD
jgi:hypothetical protein